MVIKENDHQTLNEYRISCRVHVTTILIWTMYKFYHRLKANIANIK